MADTPYYNEGLLNEREGAPHILGIGDSWFWYPGWNLLFGINQALKKEFVVFTYGENGADAQDWTKSSFLKQWSMGVRTYRHKMKLMLLSGGGNDFAGVPDFNNIIRFDCSSARSVEDCWADGEPGRLFGRVERAYRRVIEVTRECRYSGPILVHNYDYARPTGSGFMGPSNWLKVPMDQAKVPGRLRVPLLKALIDAFEVRLRALEAGHDNVFLVDSSGTLGDDEWANELHPTKAGFNRIVREAWMPVIRQHL